MSGFIVHICFDPLKQPGEAGRSAKQYTNISPSGLWEHFLSCHIVLVAVWLNIYSVILTTTQSPSIILSKYLHQHFSSQRSECVCLFNWLWGPQQLNLWDHWDFDVRFACKISTCEKRSICMTKGGEGMTCLMTFKHWACQAMRRRIRLKQRHRSLFFL